jgi:hypothetical protein
VFILKYFIANHFISLKDVHVELFPPPPKLSECDFKQWIDDYMISKDEEYEAWVKMAGAMRKGVSSSKYSCLLYFVLLFCYGVIPFP